MARRVRRTDASVSAQADIAGAEKSEHITFPDGIISRSLQPTCNKSRTSIDQASIEDKMRSLATLVSTKKRKSRDDDEQEDLATSILDDIAGAAEDGSDTPSKDMQATCISISGFLHPRLITDLTTLAE